MHFSQSVSIIQSQVGIIRGVQVLYSDTVSTLDAHINWHETYIHTHNPHKLNFFLMHKQAICASKPK